jgi:Fe-S cluster biogenesis protein NfuA
MNTERSVTSRWIEVNQILDTLRPAMEADGGGIEYFEVDDNTGDVWVRLKGACLLCPSIKLTLEHGIAVTLRSQLSWVKDVKQLF